MVHDTSCSSAFQAIAGMWTIFDNVCAFCAAELYRLNRCASSLFSRAVGRLAVRRPSRTSIMLTSTVHHAHLLLTGTAYLPPAHSSQPHCTVALSAGGRGPGCFKVRLRTRSTASTALIRRRTFAAFQPTVTTMGIRTSRSSTTARLCGRALFPRRHRRHCRRRRRRRRRHRRR